MDSGVASCCVWVHGSVSFWRRNRRWFVLGQRGISSGQRTGNVRFDEQTNTATAGLHMKVKGGKRSFCLRRRDSDRIQGV